jgi:molybdate transport system ATP-binding protein
MAGLSVGLRQAAPIPLEVDLACAPGEMLALVGPSGSGKSTVLRCIAGLAQVGEGRVAVAGEVWLDRAAGIDVPTHRRRVGMVFQSYALFPHLTARENVEIALAAGSVAERRARADELLAQVRLEGLEDRGPAELSGGQQQRVAVARALARDPAVLLLDEPFSAVDKATRGRLYRELALLRRRLAMPIVLVTHDLDEAMMLADRMALLEHGRILQCGSPDEVVSRPASVAAARLVGHRNIFPGRIAHHDEALARTMLDWRGRLLEIAHAPHWPAGTPVSWLVPPSKVVLHRRDRPSRGEGENPVQGRIEEMIRLGDTVIVTLELEGAETRRLTMHVPRHVAERNGLAVGATVGASLVGDAVHPMPVAVPRRRESAASPDRGPPEGEA